MSAFYFIDFFQCGACYRVYKHRKNLVRHVKHECGQGKKFICPICNKGLTQKSSLKVHMKQVHDWVF